MKSYLEIFFVTAEACESIKYSKVHIEITDDVRNPDEIIIEAARMPSDAIPAVCGEQFISHSTSWRYEYDGSIFLTYLIYSEYIDFRQYKSKILFLKDMEISDSSSADRPRPGNIKEKHIISHGMRHLSYLVRHSNGDIYNDIVSSKSHLLFSKILPAFAGKVN